VAQVSKLIRRQSSCVRRAGSYYTGCILLATPHLGTQTRRITSVSNRSRIVLCGGPADLGLAVAGRLPSVPLMRALDRTTRRWRSGLGGFNHVGCAPERDGMDLRHGGRRLGVSLVRITIDTREDSYEDALGVLRRAYGRHRVTRKDEESRGAVDSSEGGAVAKEAGIRSAPVGRKDASLRREPARGDGRPAAKRTSATRTAAADSLVSKSTGKRAAAKKGARGAPAGERPGAPRTRAAAGVAAANTAPRGASEAVRAWAQDQGMQVRARGRMPAKVIAAYLEAHPN
jgi:hypothetical protein